MSEIICGERWILSNQKRVFDVALSGSILPLTIPLAAVGGSAFWLESRVNPLLYQTRLGRYNKEMNMIKLRTMPYNEDFKDASNGHADLRASKVGKILRKLTIDEIPQSLHILSGQMSVVGPRPLVKSDVDMTMDILNPYEQKEWLRARSIAKPGWISDFANLSRSILPQSEEYLRTRVMYDCQYLETASFSTDMRVLRDALRIGASLVQSAST